VTAAADPGARGAGVVLTGTCVVPGIVAGPAERMPAPPAEPPEAVCEPTASTDEAAERIAVAAHAVHDELVAAASAASGTSAELLRTTAAMATDPTLVTSAEALVRTERLTPERAAWVAGTALVRQLAGLGGVLAERSRDVADVRDRIVAALMGRPAPGLPHPGHRFVLVAGDLAPADAARLDPAEVAALVLGGGTTTSHTAILARALGIPTLVGVAGADEVGTGTQLVVDAGAGLVHLDPDSALVARAAAAPARRRTFDGRGRTLDGHLVPLLANIGRPVEAAPAAAAGAEGVGLFRTEFCFLDRAEAPGHDEQVAAYREVFAAFEGRKVVVRTLDAGADKPLAFLGAHDEPNPALGLRGVRTALFAPEVLDTQLAAIADARDSEHADVWVMAPMVATADEADEFVDRCARHGLPWAGIMIEVPAAALAAGHLLRRATFASIGTNDLTQYTMAADRLLPALNALTTPWQPAVLALVAEACRGAAARGRPVGVCGEAAADPALAVVLVGLGVATLSMSSSALADVAAALGAVPLADCERAARRAVEAASADEARAAARSALPVLGDLGL